MAYVQGSPRWGSIIESLDATRLVKEVLNVISSNKLIAMQGVEVELSIVGRSVGGDTCIEALLTVRVGDEGVAGMDTSVVAALAERLEMIGLDVAGIRGGEGYVEFILRVEKKGSCTIRS